MRQPSVHRGRLSRLMLGCILQLLLLAYHRSVIGTAVINTNTFDLPFWPEAVGAGNGDNTIAGFPDQPVIELHDRISPTFHCHRTKRQLSSSAVDDERPAPTSGLPRRLRQHRERLTVQYGMRGETMTLDLTLNENLIPDGSYRFVEQTADGRDLVRQLGRDEVELCHYEGTVRERPGSRVAISTCGGTIDGVIYEPDETFLIQYHNDTHLLYRRRPKRGIAEGGQPHPSMELGQDEDTNRPEQVPADGGGKLAFSTGYREDAESLFVELALVVDRTLFLKFGSNVQRVHRHCLSVVNVLNELYRPLNVYVLLVGVVLWNTRDNIVLSRDSKQTLSSFLAYRRDTLLRQVPNDAAHLLTAVRFQDGVVGKAELGSMCSTGGSGGIAVVENFVVAPLATTLAHELGHNFNIDHDSDECGGDGGSRCPGPGPCIMEARLRDSIDVPSRWSECSRADLRDSLARGLGACLRNKPPRLLVRAVCGNGLLEPGEQCDCGHPDRCDNACCDPGTCQLRANATCATGPCCDRGTCQPRPAGTECRSAAGECDLPEYCDGQGELCPADVFRRDTSPCAAGEAYCFRGRCNTRDRQCRLLWGETGRSGPEVCYQSNANGTIFGNCGNELVTDRYERCAEHDLQCGLLHCTHQNEKLEYGVEAYAKRTATRYEQWGPRGTKRHIVCNAAIVDLGLDVRNPGLVPDGTRCGAGKMCHQQRCVAISALQERDIGDPCPGNCSGRGVCNSEGHCHCDPGFAPPFCDRPGEGGSIDSGPIGRGGRQLSMDSLVLVLVSGATVGGLVIVSLLVFVTARPFLMTHVRLALKRFRERKYGHIVPPASPTTGLLAPLAVSKDSHHKRPVVAPPPPPPPPPPPAPKPPVSQSFINVNISTDGKVTIENKRIHAPFLLHQPSVVDRHEAFRLKYSLEGVAAAPDHPLVTAEMHPSAAGKPVQDLRQIDRMQSYHSQRSKSDDRPAATRMLPKLPRQHTVGDFDAIERLPEPEDRNQTGDQRRRGGYRPQAKPVAVPRPLPRVLGAPSVGTAVPPRLLPATPTPTANAERPVMGANVAALRAKLNLAEIGTKR